MCHTLLRHKENLKCSIDDKSGIYFNEQVFCNSKVDANVLHTKFKLPLGNFGDNYFSTICHKNKIKCFI